ncbi:hypothetical protein Syun_027122 [Stephania yunnanensis]|uniref:Bulb-type lectin domain-containing protein n=1 Tax=Stephania yunnanensis TaxID=152371 RepID=A0AAP0EF46_9MAGN
MVWVANINNPINDSSSGVVKIDGRGNLAIFNGNSSYPVWLTKVSIPISDNIDFSTLTYKLLDSGNLVLIQENKGDILWQRFDHPTDTLTDGTISGLDRETVLIITASVERLGVAIQIML